MSARADITIEIAGESDLRTKMGQAWELVCKGVKAGPVVVKLGRPKRNNSMNAKLWAMLADVAAQVEWYGRKLDNEDWKHVFTAALKQQEAVPGINGGFVVLGTRTSRMNKEVFSQLIELIYAFGSDHQVRWSEPALKAYEEYANACA